MSTRARKAKVSLLDDKIHILDRGATECSPAKEVFRTVAAILALVRDKTVTNKESVQLSDYCFDACEALKTTIEEGNADGYVLNVTLEGLGRVTSEIERTLKRGASTPHIKFDKGMIGIYKSEIQTLLDYLNNGYNGVCERTAQSLPADSSGAAAASASGRRAFERLIRWEFVPHELPSLIEEILVCKDVFDTIRCLPRDDAQTFIDAVNEALDMPELSPWAQNQCLRPLYRTCGRYALLPKAMEIPTCYDPTGNALYSGGYADVWKGKYLGGDVAVKVIRTFSNSDLAKVIGKFCKEAITWKTLRHPNVLPLIGVTMTETKFAMISDWMDNGNLNEFVEANPDADRFKLLGDAARGLIYIHERGVVHGDLKGANILVDQTYRARLADFGLLTVVSDPANILPSSSYAPGGTARWMSPERISPEDFGFKTSRPSISSDCYSLGMVIYEIISGNVPFHKDIDFAVFVKVLRGARPPREEGFPNNLWNMLERCWMPQPRHRPSVEDVLQCLEACSDQTGEHNPRAIMSNPQLHTALEVHTSRGPPPTAILPLRFNPSHWSFTVISPDEQTPHSHEPLTNAPLGGRGILNEPQPHTGPAIPITPTSQSCVHPQPNPFLPFVAGYPLPHIQGDDDAASKETQHLRRRCYNCHTTKPPSWHRSTLTPGKIVCNKCGLYERTHLRPRPLRFDELRPGNKSRNQSKVARPEGLKIIPGWMSRVEKEELAPILPHHAGPEQERIDEGRYLWQRRFDAVQEERREVDRQRRDHLWREVPRGFDEREQ